MKHILFPLFALAMASFSCLNVRGAETAEADTRPMWGVRAAFDINIPGRWHGDAGSVKMYRSGCGFSAGAVCNIWLGRNFYLEPGLTFFYDTYSMDDVHFMVGSGSDPYISDPSLYKAGLRVPLMVGYSFPLSERLSVSVFTGPELSYAFAGKIRLSDSEREQLGDDFPTGLFGDFQRRMDCAWKFGVGVPLGLWLVSAEGSVGMTDLLKGGMSFRENRLCLALTRYF